MEDAEVIPLYPKPLPEAKCSFCGRSKSQTGAMVLGIAGKYICNHCVKAAVKILKGEQADADHQE